MSGPSFLGLSDDPVHTQDRRRSSDDLYRTNWGMRLFVVFIILAAASGLIFLQWRSGHVQASQHAAPAAAASQPNDAVNPSSATVPPATNAAANAPATSEAKAPATASPKPVQDTNQLKTEAKLNNVTNPAAAPPKAVSSTKSVPQADALREGHEVATGKPVADLEQPVRQAESYLQGKGVPRSCDQALNILRTASDHGNPRAQIKLGALYATGTCTTVDRVTAYRYFSRAMRSQPNNTWLEQSRSSLWSKMNASERKQAMDVVR